jgi:hypothetical protein
MNSGALNDTSSTEYVDLPGAIITTKSLAQLGDYIIMFSALMNGSLNNTTANFRVSIDGTPVDVNGTNVRLKVKDLDIGYAISCVAESVPENAEVKVEYKTDLGTLSIEEFNLLVDGVPQSRVIE